MEMHSRFRSIPPDTLPADFSNKRLCGPMFANTSFRNEFHNRAQRPVQQLIKDTSWEWNHLIAKHAHKEIGDVVDDDYDRAQEYPGEQVKSCPPVGKGQFCQRIDFWKQCMLPPAAESNTEGNTIHERNK